MNEGKDNVDVASTITVISLGAGVQSSCMALMAGAGEIKPMPVAAIFADTQSEEMGTYEWLDKLSELLPFPVIRVSIGNLGEDFIRSLCSDDARCAVPPFYTLGQDNSCGMLPRQCTRDYKVYPIRRKIRELLKVHGAKHCRQLVGISLDEAHRMRDSDVKFVTNEYPLVDIGMTRRDCVRKLAEYGVGMPPKSACYFCPYHSDMFWVEMKRDRPNEFMRAVEFENGIRDAQARSTKKNPIKSRIYLHRSLRPLVEAVFDPNDGQLDLFGNECQGMCGV